jgi:RNA polymerase sigma-70 factor (ECF subfamily)
MPGHSSSVWMSATTATQSTATTVTDQTLVAAYRGGDERAAAELVGRHAAAVARFLYSSGAAREEIDDLVQEALFRAFRRLESWRGDASFRTWLLSIAGNLLKDRARAEQGRYLVSLEGHEIADTADPDAHLATRDLQERLRQELARLPRLQREVFLLRALEGSGYEEIAIALGTTAGAARVHYHNAVKRLKELIR